MTRAPDTATYFAQRCWDHFLDPRAYYWLRISYQNHARLNRREQVQ